MASLEAWKHTTVTNENFALNIPRQRDVKLNELPKHIFMLLPLLLHWLYFFILGETVWGPWNPWDLPRPSPE